MPKYKKPPVIENGESQRSATWLELFFDVVFVVSMAALAHNTQNDLSPNGIFRFAIIFLVLFWLWVEFSYYSDLFDTKGRLHQAFILLGMFGMVILTVVIRMDNMEVANLIATVYMSLTFLLVVMHAIAGYYVKQWRNMNVTFMVAMLISLAFWGGSFFVEVPHKFIFWIAGILVQATAGPHIYLVQKNYPEHESHMPERFGLFMIIVLGEGITSIIVGLDAVDWNPVSTGVASISFLMLAAVWKLYFYHAKENNVTEAIKSDALYKSFLFGYLHYFIYGSITLMSVAVLTEIKNLFGEASGDALPFFFASGICYLVSLTVSQWAAPLSLSRRTITGRCMGIIILTALLFLDALSVLQSMGIQLMVLIGLVVHEYYANNFQYSRN